MIFKPVRKSEQRNLTSTLSSAFIGLCVFVLLILGGVNVALIIKTQREMGAGRQQLIAKDATNVVSNFIQDKVTILKTAVKLTDLATGNLTNQKRTLRKMLGHTQSFRQLVLVDSQGENIVAVSLRSLNNTKIIAAKNITDIFAQIEKKNYYISDIHIGQDSKEPMVDIAVALTDIYGNEKGALIAEVNLKFMWTLVDNLKIGESGQAYVVDKSGTLLASGDFGRVLKGENLSTIRKVRSFIHSNTPIDVEGARIFTGIDNTLTFGTYVPLQSPDWALVTEVPILEAYQDVFNGLAIAISILLILSLFSGIAGRIIAKKIALPLLNLTETATRISEGDLSLKARAEGPKEFVNLAIAFNQMTEQLGQSLREEEERTKLLQHEIEQRKIAEESLSNSLTRLQAIYNTMPVTVWSMDEKGVFTLSEGKELEKLGLQPKQVVGQSVFEIYKDTQLIIDNTNAALAGEAREYETEVLGQSYQTFLSPCIDENKKVIGLNGLAINVTDKKLAEKEVRGLRNYLFNIINSMPSMIVGVDRDTNITLWNKTVEDATGIKANEARGKSAIHLLPHLALEKDNIIRSIQNRQVIQEQKKPSLVNDEEIYEDLTIYPLTTNGVEGAVIRVDDVTEQVRFEEAMVQSEKMASVGGLAAGMAHEINNPLGVISAAAQNIRRRISPDLNKNVTVAEELGISLEAMARYMENRGIYNYIEGITASVHRASTIVRNMLDFSRKSESIRVQSQVSDLLDNAVDLASSDYDLKKRFDFRSIEIDRQYGEDVPDVFVMATEIEQVFLNLLKNAAQAMAEKTYQGMTPKIILKIYHDEDWVWIEVDDNGPGMSEHVRKRIFEPFFTTKEVGVGTGLGLSVSYFIISNNHEGNIFVESSPGLGTKFIVRLPILS